MPELDAAAVVIEPMGRSDLDFAIEHAAAEGWNPGWSDAECFHAADPDGFWIARLNDQPVGCISAVRYGASFAFVGLFIVIKGFRGHGIGGALWAAAAPHIAGCVIGLDGVVVMQPTYAGAGFVLAHRNVRYEGVVEPNVAAGSEVGSYEPDDRSALGRYDQQCFGAPRLAFLDAWLSQPGAVIRVHREGKDLAGFAVARPCRRGYKVGPLFAEDVDVASQLFDSVVAALPPGSTVVLDIPEPHDGARRLVTARSMTPTFETARMYAGGGPELDVRRVFGITSFELG